MRRRLRLAILCALTLASPALAQGGPGTIPGFAAPAPAANSLGAIEYALSEKGRLVSTERERRDRLATELDALGSSRAELERQVRTRGRALYRIRRAGLLPVAGGFEAMLAHLSRVERLERMVSADIRALRSLRDRQIALQRDIRGLDESVQAAEHEVQRLQTERARLVEQQRLMAVYEQTFVAPQLSMSPVAPVPSLTGAGGTAQLDARSFAPTFSMMRGRLGIPTSGRYRTRDIQLADGPTVAFATEASAPAKSVADGQVAFVGRYAGYGLMVIVDHGQSFFTVYAQLDSANVNVGERVRMGARVGMIGRSPMHFQVRQGTRTLNARAWLGF